jgi:hypothetical protein
MTTWRVIVQAGAARAAAVTAQQVGGDTTFIEEDVLTGVVERLRVAPAPTVSGDVRPALFVGVYGFF